MKNQRKIGILMSYFCTVLNMCVSIFFTPFLISTLGDSEYGLYKIIHSFAGQFIIMTFGISGLLSRNIAYYNVLEKKKEKENFLAMALLITFILVSVLYIAGGVMYNYVDNIFSSSFKAEELRLAKTLFAIFIINIGVTIFNDYFSGMITGHEKFIVFYGTKVLYIFLRIIILVVLLLSGFKSIALVSTDLALGIGVLVFNIIYAFFCLKEKIKYYYIDKVMLKTSLAYSFAMVMQAIINQVNQSLDSFILGLTVSPEIVALYSIALTIYTAYNGLCYSFVSVFVPKATRMIAKGATPDNLTNFVSQNGRYQFIIALAIITGFSLFGHNFIMIWVGKKYLAVYKIVLLLIVPVTITLITGAANVILDAKLKKMGRSVILAVTAVINVVTSFILIKKMGYIGAAYGTMIATILGYGIVMNVYYKKAIGLRIFKMYMDIFRGILPSGVVSGIICIPLSVLLPNTFIMFILKLSLFVLLYLFIIYKFGMNEQEKLTVKAILNKAIGILNHKKQLGEDNVQK